MAKLPKEQVAEFRKVLDDLRSELHGNSALDYDETIELIDTIDALEAELSEAKAQTWAHVFQGIEEPCGCDYHSMLRDVLSRREAEEK